MVLFCILWTPVFYLFWITIRPPGGGSGELYALLTGGAIAIVRFFVPSLVEPYGFGLSRYLSAFMDYTSLPVLLPLIAAKLITLFYPRGGITDYTGFTLLALVPSALVYSTVWSASRDILRLVLTPLLWTALIMAFHPLIELAKDTLSRHRIPRKIAAVMGMAVYTMLPPFVWWSFFCQKTLDGIILLFPSFAPMIAVCVSFF
ncbi:MAG: hypothetical protein LBJ35_01315, partial [Spirochaetaceae bacterium]|nr:hypothetical protein [Spirochaetaceae bacterium]